MVLVGMLGGFALLVLGADWLVKGASSLARSLGVSGLVIGLTVVAFGTGAPEMTVSVMSALKGETDLALGNIVGSNILNILLILGISAIIVPLTVHRQLVQIDVPIMVGASALLWVFAMDQNISGAEGFFMFVSIFVYTYLQIWLSKRVKKSEQKVVEENTIPAKKAEKSLRIKQILFMLSGLLALIVGSKLLVDGATHIARNLGVSELMIGLTVLAAGTSLPEVATSVMAAIRGEREMAVGNAVGSNIFNILAVLGISAMISKGPLLVSQEALNFDIPVMTAVAIACLPIFFSGHAIRRWEGFVFLSYYVLYTTTLILKAKESESLSALSHATLVYLAPLTIITLIVSCYRYHKLHRSK